MNTECNRDQLEFQAIGRRQVQADFNGGHVSSDAGGLLLREVDRRFDFARRFASCFTDHRDPRFIEHSILELVRQRTNGLVLGYEDLNDHDELSRDPLFAVISGKADVTGEQRKLKRDKGRPLASSSTLNRLELTPAQPFAANRYWKISHDSKGLEDLFVTFFLESFSKAPEEIILDFDATDDLIHGEQEGRFFHGYYRGYCYLPLYVFCGDRLVLSKLRTSDRDGSDGSLEVLQHLVGRIRERWPAVRIVIRADSGFARDALMSWCETHAVYYNFGLPKNKRLLKRIAAELAQVKALHAETGQAARLFTSFYYRTRKSWTCARRVVAKAEHLHKGSNPRFIVSNLPDSYATAQDLYEKIYCARGDMENRIKEQQLNMFADRTSTRAFRANQLRLWFSSLAYVMVSALRRTGLKGTRLAKASCGSIRLHLLKIGALVKLSVRRLMVHLASACPYKDVFYQAWNNLRHYPLRC